ncbi:DUF6434 domain-containing protein [Algihabitans albus]|uniref:DUF6434 domain-containing protein n=1 Tax=Algihabitans albus TaxID=2164067 RepID=UPI000E5C7B6E|nr:DUF6434 domain-containing protein [Algihabitans albus]
MRASETQPEIRPDLDRIADSASFRDWYWLKSELIIFCRNHGLRCAGSKAEIAERIVHHLDTGERDIPQTPGHDRQPGRRASRINWAHLEITPETVITDSYTNGPNVRAFFRAQIGARFRFNIAFMNWMRDNCGRTMADAVEAWLRIERRRRQGEKTAIPASNQYNRYLRDFFDANPSRSMTEARICWLAKRKRRGPARYEATDLDALSE